MEELYINGIQIELPSNSISRTLQVNDLAEIKDRQSNYSNSIKITKTPSNIAAFEMLGITGNTTRLPYENLSIKYVINGIELITEGVGVVKNTNNYYNLVVYDTNVSMSELLENKELNSLDWSSYNHTLNSDLFISSFANTGGYIYGIAKYYDNYNVDFLNISLTTPSFFIHTIFDMIFTQKGYTIVGNVFAEQDYLSRVISMNKGYERIEDISTALAYKRDNSADPEVNETFSFPTIKEYIIDTYVATDTEIHNIILNGTITPTNAGLFPTISVLLNGADLETKVILEDNIIDENYSFSVTSGDSISIVLKFTSVDVGGTETITFETDYTTTINEEFRSIDIDFSTIIGDTKQIDFVKDIMQRFGLIFRKTRNENEFEFIRISELFTDKDGADDWSDKYSDFSNESYKPNYAKINRAKYKYDTSETNETPTFGDGILEVNNVNLNDDKTLFTSIFKASELDGNLYLLKQWEDKEEDEIITTVPNEDGLRIFKINRAIDTIKYFFNSDVTSFYTYNGLIPLLDFNSINYQNELDKYYREFESTISNYKKINIECNLSIVDIYELDFFKLKYFDQLGKYYYLNKVSNFKPNKKTKVELIEIVDTTLVESEISGNISGASIYSATLNKVAFGGMIGSYGGSSNYSAELSKQSLVAFLMSNTGVLEANVCAETADTTFYHDGTASIPIIGDIIYTDIGGLNPFNGNRLYYKSGAVTYIKINVDGTVLSSSFCS